MKSSSKIVRTSHDFVKKSWKAIIAYLLIFIVIYIRIIHNFEWQILDDGNVIEDRFFPPWSYWANFYRTRIGIEFSGLGLLWGFVGFITQKNLFLIYGLMLIAYIFTVHLANKIFLLISPTSRFIRYSIMFFLFFLPGGAEQYSTLVKQEKWSLIAIELILIALLIHKENAQRAYWLYLSGFILGTLAGKETFVFYLFSLMIVTIFTDKQKVKGLFLKIQLSSLLIFVVYRLFPSIFYQNDNIYTSSLLKPGFQTIKSSFFSYVVFEPYFLISVFLIIFLIVRILYLKVIVNAVIWVVLIGVLLELTLLLNWNQINAYYVSNIEFLTILILGILLSKLNADQSLIKRSLVLVLVFNLLLGLNTSIARYQITFLQHTTDAKAIQYLLSHNKNGSNAVMFGNDTEMIGNINAIAKFKNLKQIISFDDVSSCSERLVAMPVGVPTNDRFKIRGLSWPDEKSQTITLKSKVAEYREVFSNISKSRYGMLMLYFPDLKYAREKKPLLYGWKIMEVRCR